MNKKAMVAKADAEQWLTYGGLSDEVCSEIWQERLAKTVKRLKEIAAA